MTGAFPPCPFKRGATVAGCLFHSIIMGDVMFYQDRTEINLLQPFAHPENSDWFSIISVIISEVSAAAEQKKAYW